MHKKIDDPRPVIIVGAGAAGLSAAEELQKKGEDYIIFEGRDRIGGRIHTQNWPLTHPTQFELGAAWFHECPQNRLAFQAEKEGFESLYDDDQTVIYDMKGKLDQNLVNKLSKQFDEFRMKRDETDPLEQTATLFAKDLKDDEERRTALAVANGYQMLAGLKNSQISSHFEGPQGRDKAVQGGYINIFNDLVAKDVDHSRIKFNKKVVHIDSPKEGDRVQITTQDGERVEGKAAIVTVPIGVLKKGLIQFDPGLNGNIKKAITKTEVAHVDKVYLTFPSTFWNPSTYKFLISEVANPALVWNWDASHPGTRQKNTLAVLVTNDMAFELQKSPEKAFTLVKPILEVISHNGDSNIPEPTSIVHSSWVTDEFSEGSYSVVPHGETRESLAKPFEDGEPRNRLLFAGEHTIVEGAGFVQGAWLSGQRAAAQAMDL